LAEADSENRPPAGEQLLRAGDRRARTARIAGPVREHEPVRGLLVERVVPGDAAHQKTARDERGLDAALAPEVDEDDRARTGAALDGRRNADFGKEIARVRVVPRDVAALRQELAEHGAGLAQVARERARVDALEAGDSRLLEPLGERAVAP